MAEPTPEQIVKLRGLLTGAAKYTALMEDEVQAVFWAGLTLGLGYYGLMLMEIPEDEGEAFVVGRQEADRWFQIIREFRQGDGPRPTTLRGNA